MKKCQKTCGARKFCLTSLSASASSGFFVLTVAFVTEGMKFNSRNSAQCKHEDSNLKTSVTLGIVSRSPVRGKPNLY